MENYPIVSHKINPIDIGGVLSSDDTSYSKDKRPKDLGNNVLNNGISDISNGERESIAPLLDHSPPSPLSLFSFQTYKLVILRQDMYVLYFNTRCGPVNV